MTYHDFLVRLINNLADMEDDCRILQVGPGGNTYEIVARPGSVVKNQTKNKQQPGKTSFHCNTCPFRVECQKGRGIRNYQLPDGECLFDKIIIHANADLERKDLFGEATRILKVGGQVIVLMRSGENNGNRILRDFCFQTDGIIEQLNTHRLAIKSASAFKLSSSVAMYLIISKYLDVN
ncbi:MAG: hypothetical protein AB7D05_09810 [Mangrovibacterium sp.]